MKKALILSLSTLLIFNLTSCKEKAVEADFNYISIDGKTYKNKAYYKDSYFFNGNNYDNELATLSLALELAAFPSNEQVDENFKEFLTPFDFHNFKGNEYYYSSPTKDSFGVVFATKKFDDFTLIVSGTRGGKYGSEWASNFKVGNDQRFHEGFYDAAKIYIQSLRDYISSSFIRGKIKLWTTGYSRSSAATNIAIGLIDELIEKDKLKTYFPSITLTKEDIFCYLFETPSGVKRNAFKKDSPTYSNIHNILNFNDPVIYLSPKYFDFTRYGVDHYLFDKRNFIDYEKVKIDIKNKYESLEDKEVIGNYSIDNFTSSSRINYTQGMYLEELINYLAKEHIKTIDNYITYYQKPLMEIFDFLFIDGDREIKNKIIDLKDSMIENGLQEIIDSSLSFEEKVEKAVPIITKALIEKGLNLNEEEASNFINLMLEFIKNLAEKRRDLLLPLLNFENYLGFGQAHLYETTFAQLTVQDSNYTNKPYKNSNLDSYYYIETEKANQDISIYLKGEEVVKIKDGKVKKVESTSYSYGEEEKLIKIYLPLGQKYEVKVNNLVSASLYRFNPLLDSYTLIEEFTKDTVINK